MAHLSVGDETTLRLAPTAEIGQQLVADIGQIAVETVPCRALAEDALELAIATGRSVCVRAAPSPCARVPDDGVPGVPEDVSAFA